MTNNIKQFLEADVLRTQGELVVSDMGNGNSMIMDTIRDVGDRYVGETFYVEDANFIAAASRIAPDIRQLLAAFEQVCEVLEAINKRSYSHIEPYDDLFARFHPRKTLDIKRRVDGVETWFEGDWLTYLWGEIKRGREALTAAAPYRKTGV